MLRFLLKVEFNLSYFKVLKPGFSVQYRLVAAKMEETLSICFERLTVPLWGS